ncbi:MAG TPA: GNAT family N-acetyltransferase [archaeon]|nr:GNAT family N-acetyltransferase [archaeon]
MKVVRVDESLVGEIAALLRKEFVKPPYNEKWVLSQLVSRVEEVFTDNRKYCFAAIEENIVVGVVLASTIVFREGSRCFVEEFVVDSEKQDKGVGTTLLQRLEEECAKAGIGTLWVTANRKSRAQDFYEKNGFKASDYRLMEKKVK